jgi:hypothetical protein
MNITQVDVVEEDYTLRPLRPCGCAGTDRSRGGEIPKLINLYDFASFARPLSKGDPHKCPHEERKQRQDPVQDMIHRLAFVDNHGVERRAVLNAAAATNSSYDCAVKNRRPAPIGSRLALRHITAPIRQAAAVEIPLRRPAA